MKTFTSEFLPSRRHARAAFTLVEVLVSSVLVVLIMGLLLSTVDQTQKIWGRGRAVVSQFQSARAAFESMTRQLSQATLNTYYDIEYKKDTGGLTTTEPSTFYRQSELHFITGKAFQSKLFDDAKVDSARTKDMYPTHAMFFQTPTGYSTPAGRAATGTTTSGLSNTRDEQSLLAAVGFYIKWGPDEDRPSFITKDPSWPRKNRFRLYRVQQPSEGLGLFYNAFEYTTVPAQFNIVTGWVKSALNPDYFNKLPSTKPRAIADNIVALIIMPKLAEKDRPTLDGVYNIAQKYEYDSRPAKGDGKAMTKTEVTAAGVATGKQYNQLPPIVQVTMVAIDEPSAQRLEDLFGDVPPPLMDDLFETLGNTAQFEDRYIKDLGTDPTATAGTDSVVTRLTTGIGGKTFRLTYRIYTMDVVLRGAKWSSDS